MEVSTKAGQKKTGRTGAGWVFPRERGDWGLGLLGRDLGEKGTNLKSKRGQEISL